MSMWEQGHSGGRCFGTSEEEEYVSMLRSPWPFVATNVSISYSPNGHVSGIRWHCAFESLLLLIFSSDYITEINDVSSPFLSIIFLCGFGRCQSIC